MQKARNLLLQAAIVGAVLLALYALAAVVAAKMRGLGVEPGFGFLAQRAGFDIGVSLIAFDSTHSYCRAFLVGLLYSLSVAAGAVVARLVIGAALRLRPTARHR